ncbi:hypothetical protein [Streptomyces achromogenes]|uniref:hypothetical protein n=1 Tax=Streptomyces achromogenes TaxID=67255 RepID=UPI0004CBA3B0|nr:hypothetical protein [Streptomyces achromogenes]
MTFRRTPAGGHEPGSPPTVGGCGGWLAVGHDFNGVFAEVYRSARQGPACAADTAALTASVLDCSRAHGGRPVLTDEPQRPAARGPAQGS